MRGSARGGGVITWFKVDDGLPTHHKVLSIPRGRRRREAVGSWTLAGAWCSGNKTEGRIPKPALVDLDIPQKVADDLVAAGLWRDEGLHYQMHDFLDYNPTAEQVTKARTDAAERQRRARERARERRNKGDVSRVSHAPVTRDVTDPRHGPPDPTRPDPVLACPDERTEVEVQDARAAIQRAIESWGLNLPDEASA